MSSWQDRQAELLHTSVSKIKNIWSSVTLPLTAVNGLHIIMTYIYIYIYIYIAAVSVSDTQLHLIMNCNGSGSDVARPGPLSHICLEGQTEPQEELGLNTLSVDT